LRSAPRSASEKSLPALGFCENRFRRIANEAAGVLRRRL
jgi:hypothetical protein